METRKINKDKETKSLAWFVVPIDVEQGKFENEHEN